MVDKQVSYSEKDYYVTSFLEQHKNNPIFNMSFEDYNWAILGSQKKLTELMASFKLDEDFIALCNTVFLTQKQLLFHKKCSKKETQLWQFKYCLLLTFSNQETEQYKSIKEEFISSIKNAIKSDNGCYNKLSLVKIMLGMALGMFSLIAVTTYNDFLFRDVEKTKKSKKIEERIYDKPTAANGEEEESEDDCSNSSDNDLEDLLKAICDNLKEFFPKLTLDKCIVKVFMMLISHFGTISSDLSELILKEKLKEKFSKEEHIFDFYMDLLDITEKVFQPDEKDSDSVNSDDSDKADNLLNGEFKELNRKWKLNGLSEEEFAKATKSFMSLDLQKAIIESSLEFN